MRLSPSPAAQFQATKTRAVLAVQLLFQAAVTTLTLWTALMTGLVWHQVGIYLPQLDHVFFGRWMTCSILGETPFLSRFTWWIGIPFNGVHLRLDTASAWLAGPGLYRHTFYQAFYHAATNGWGLAIDLIPLSFVVLLIGWRVRQHPAGGDHLRGLQLLAPKELNCQLHGGIIKRLLHGQPPGLRLGKIIVPRRYECEHFMIVGNSGSGKTTTIRAMLRQIAKWQHAAIILDREGEFTQEFFSEERGDWILQPLDQRCPAWSPWSELRDDTFFGADAAAMAASLIRGRPKSESERFFQDSTRTVVESILHVARDNPDPESLLTLVSLERGALREALRNTPAYALIDPEAHDQGAGILGTAANDIKTFVHLPKRHQASRSWSAREWERERPGWIFFPSREDIDEATRTLQALWLDCLVRWLMHAEIGSPQARTQTWIIADEVASLGHQPMIEKLLTRGRKRSIAAVLGLQNVSQLRDLYGAEGCITITSSPSTKLILRVDETETANWASKQIDGHEVDRLTMTQLAGLSSYREGINLSEQRTTEPLVLPSEIKLLKPFTGYLCLAGEHRTTVRIPELHMISRQPAFLPRPATSPPELQAPAEPDEQEIAAQMLSRGPRPVED